MMEGKQSYFLVVKSVDASDALAVVPTVPLDMSDIDDLHALDRLKAWLYRQFPSTDMFEIYDAQYAYIGTTYPHPE